VECARLILNPVGSWHVKMAPYWIGANWG